MDFIRWVMPGALPDIKDISFGNDVVPRAAPVQGKLPLISSHLSVRADTPWGNTPAKVRSAKVRSAKVRSDCVVDPRLKRSPGCPKKALTHLCFAPGHGLQYFHVHCLSCLPHVQQYMFLSRRLVACSSS